LRLRCLVLVCALVVCPNGAGAEGELPARIDSEPAPLDGRDPAPEVARRSASVLAAMAALDRGEDAAVLRLLETAARSGDVEAQFVLADLLWHGAIAGADGEAALRWYRRAVLNGSRDASGRLLEIRGEIARGVPEIAAFQRPDSDVPAGWILVFTLGRVDEGVATLIREAGTLSPQAQLALEVLYENPVEGGPPLHDPRIRRFFLESAAEGLPDSIVFVGKMFAQGWGVPQDEERALEILQTVRSFPHSRLAIASIHLRRGERSLAEENWRAAGEMGDALGWYEFGASKRLQGEHATANEAFRQALQLDPEMNQALIGLGRAYMEGWGTEADPRAGIDLYERAAELGDPAAQFVLGELLLRGVGRPRDEERARQLLEESAGQGFGPAIQLLQQWERDGRSSD
jgi:TPR repeat protein